MKKLISVVVLALVIVLTMSVSVFAADTEINNGTVNKNGNTNVTYTVAPTYTVTIPESVILGSTATVSAENVVLAKGNQVVVKLTDTSEDDNAFKVKCEDEALTYTVKNGDTTVNINDTVLTVNPASSATGSTTLSFSEPENVKYAGTYTGTVTFTVSVAASESN